MIIESRVHPFKEGQPFHAIEPLLLRGIHELIDTLGTRQKRLLAIGIAISGIVNYQNGKLVSSPFLNWKNIDFRSILQSEFNVDVYIDNDVNCFALAQNWLGKGRGCSNFMTINISDGIGAGIITDGKLYRGYAGGAGEIGHMIIHAGGKDCYCGQKGCLEAYASSRAICESISAEKGQSFSFDQVLAMANSGDEVCRNAFQAAGEYFGWGLINVIMHFDPDKIIVGGEMILKNNFLLPNALRIMYENWFHNLGEIDTRIETDELGGDGFLLGAAVLTLSEILSKPIYQNFKTSLYSKLA